MKPEEILEAAKEAGLLHKDAKTVSGLVLDFAAIIEKRTIERCSDVVYRKAALLGGPIDQAYLHECAAAIRKLGEQ